MLIKVLVVTVLAGIIASLAYGLFHMLRDKGNSKRMVTALTVRITLSVLLFILLLVAYKTGLIQPHGITPPSNTQGRNAPLQSEPINKNI
jgi:predicted PurR-regulated permease PerM